MSIEVGTAVRSGAVRRRALAIAAAVAGVALVVTAVAVWVSSGVPSYRPITLRVVQSSVGGACALGPLVTEDAGSACDASGNQVYDLGESLGDLRVLHAEVTGTGDAARLELRVDDAGRSTLADVTGQLVGERLAMLADGVVLAAPTVAAPIDVPELELAFSSTVEATAVLERLSAAPSD